ncbi:MAG: four helix bundle protein [Chitinophagales bacterium]
MENKITTFETLECYKVGVELRKEIAILVKSFPVEEKYRLADQMTRCSRSVTNNIAEGYGRFHYLDNAKFCRNSRGSLMELLDHLLIAQESEYITIEQLSEFRQKINKNNALINGYIQYLLKAKKES